MPELRSALADAVPVRRGHDLEMTEVTGRDLVQLAGWPANFDGVAARLAGLVDCPVPADTRTAGEHGGVTLFRVGPERLWIAAPMGRITAARLQQAFAAEEAVATELGHARTVLRLAGSAAPTLLARLLAIDLDPTAFPVGAFAQTPLQQIGVLLHHAGPDLFDLYVPRSYALFVWDRLKQS